MSLKTQILDPEVHAPVPLDWRTLTEKELRRLKKGKKITLTFMDGLEEQIFAGFTETGLVETWRDASYLSRNIRYTFGRHRIVLHSPQVENLDANYYYDS